MTIVPLKSQQVNGEAEVGIPFVIGVQTQRHQADA